MVAQKGRRNALDRCAGQGEFEGCGRRGKRVGSFGVVGCFWVQGGNVLGVGDLADGGIDEVERDGRVPDDRGGEVVPGRSG